jgi:hypothetical protein
MSDNEGERWFFQDYHDGAVELIIPDCGQNDEHYNDAMSALTDLYKKDEPNAWWVVDTGPYGENGEYLLLRKAD